MQRHNVFTFPWNGRETLIDLVQRSNFACASALSIFPLETRVTYQKQRTKRDVHIWEWTAGGTSFPKCFPFWNIGLDVSRYPIAEEGIPLMHLFFSESIPSTPVFETSIIGLKQKSSFLRELNETSRGNVSGHSRNNAALYGYLGKLKLISLGCVY